jgi:radical SAM superfamily enzyme YgiQ (UPF0313 family)
LTPIAAMTAPPRAKSTLPGPHRPLVLIPTDLPPTQSGLRLGLTAIADAIEAHNAPFAGRVVHLHHEGIPDLSTTIAVVFSLSHPLEFRVLLRFCRLAKIPLQRRHRGPGDPIFLGGGMAFTNPEPLADFFDAIILGLDPSPLLALLDIIQCRGSVPRSVILADFTQVPNVYIPEKIEFAYSPEGQIASISPGYEVLTAKPVMVARPLSGRFSPSEAVLMPDVGCRNRCAFCALTFHYRYDSADLTALTREIEALAARGVTSIKLNSATAFQHPDIIPLIDEIKRRGLRIAVGSVRVDQVSSEHLESLDGAHAISATQFLYRDGLMNGAPSLTFGIEAVSDRLLRLVNKGMDTEQIQARLERLVGSGLRNVGLYFLSGLPTETPTDRHAVADLIAYTVELLGRWNGQVLVNVNPLIPMPQTPMQRVELSSTVEFDTWMRDLRRELLITLGQRRYEKHVRLSGMPTRDLLIETITARSDRRIGRALELLHEQFRSTVENDSQAEALLQQARLPGLDFYRRRIGPGEILPWQLVEYPAVRAAEAAYYRREVVAMRARPAVL